MKPILFVLSGLPASGKSTLSKLITKEYEAFYLRIDTIEQGLRDLCNFDVQGEGYRLSYRIADDNLKLGHNVVSDSCNPITLTRREWEEVAKKNDSILVNIEVICSDEKEHRKRIETRKEEVKGLKLPTWEEVENREYHSWNSERITIDTANKSIEESFEELNDKIKRYLKPVDKVSSTKPPTIVRQYKTNNIMKKKKGLAIITGASQGIGSAIAIGLANDGYRVVLIARNEQNLHKVYNEIMQSNEHIQEPVVLPLDITDYAKVDYEIKTIHQKYGTIDILVNAAAMFIDGSLNEPVDKFKEIIEINVVAQYSMLKTVAEIMKAQKNGYIFNIASRAAKYGFPDGGIYGSTKFAFLGLTESLYRELAPLGIRVTSLCPGWVNTEMAKKAKTPLKDEEMIQPCDLLNTIRYLLDLSENVCIKEIVFEMKKSII
jgi:Short-chain alcohol dehydrogenase of unknown specificity